MTDTDTITVVSSGTTFSLLLYENVQVELDDDQDGLILGEVISRETHKLTDTDRRIVIRHDNIYIKSIVPCPAQFFYYNAAGEVDESKLKILLENNFDNFIGWYIYKRDSNKLTLREKIIHKNLMQFSSNPTFFTNCIVTSDLNSNSSTYTSTQIFTRFNMSEFERLPLQITNMSDSVYVFKSSEASRSVMNDYIKSIKNTKKDVDVADIQADLRKRVNGMLEKVSAKEHELFALEQEIKELREEQNLEIQSFKPTLPNTDNNMELADALTSDEDVFNEIKRKVKVNNPNSSTENEEISTSHNIKEQRKVLECKRKLSTKKSEPAEDKMDIEDMLSNDEDEINNEVPPEQTKKRRGKSKLKSTNNVEHFTPIETYSRKTRSGRKTYAETTQNK